MRAPGAGWRLGRQRYIYSSWFRLYAAYVATAPAPAMCMQNALAVLWQLHKSEGILPDLAIYRVGGGGGRFAARVRSATVLTRSARAACRARATAPQSLLEIAGRRGLSKEARFVFRDMTASNVQADAAAYGWRVQAVAANGVDPLSKGPPPKHRSVLFDQPLEMGGLEVILGAVCRKWCPSRAERRVWEAAAAFTDAPGAGADVVQRGCGQPLCHERGRGHGWMAQRRRQVRATALHVRPTPFPTG